MNSMSKLTKYLNELKDFGVTRAMIADDNKISRQYVHIIFKNYSKAFMCYQKYLLDKAIDKKISDLQDQMIYLEGMKMWIAKDIESEVDENGRKEYSEEASI